MPNLKGKIFIVPIYYFFYPSFVRRIYNEQTELSNDYFLNNDLITKMVIVSYKLSLTTSLSVNNLSLLLSYQIVLFLIVTFPYLLNCRYQIVRLPNCQLPPVSFSKFFSARWDARSLPWLGLPAIFGPDYTRIKEFQMQRSSFLKCGKAHS